MNDELKKLFIKFSPVGSRVTCNPPPMDTDEDFLCLVEEGSFIKLYTMLDDDGYELGGSVPFNDKTLSDDDCFSSFKKGDINIIATASPVFFDLFMQATNEATRLNLLVKNDRISLFQKILYGNEVAL